MRAARVNQTDCAKRFGVHLRVITRLLDDNRASRNLVVRAIGRCPTCSKEYEKERSSRIHCSAKCASVSKAALPISDAEVERMYVAGQTQDEIAHEIGVSQKSIYKSLRRNHVTTRTAAKRNQHGEANHMWKGDTIGYKSAHSRVRSVRGAPLKCEKCGATDGLEWASVSRKYHDPSDYIPLCIPCHRRMDAAARRAQ